MLIPVCCAELVEPTGSEVAGARKIYRTDRGVSSEAGRARLDKSDAATYELRREDVVHIPHLPSESIEIKAVQRPLVLYARKQDVRRTTGSQDSIHVPRCRLTLFGSRTRFLSAFVIFTAPSAPPEAIMGWKGEPSTVYTRGSVQGPNGQLIRYRVRSPLHDSLYISRRATRLGGSCRTG